MKEQNSDSSLIKKINACCLMLSVIALLSIMVIAAVNMLFRPLGYPITGSFEIMGYLSALITALGLGFSYEKRSHIAVDILFKKFPNGLKLVFSSIGKLICCLFFGLVSWKMLILALNFKKNGELSETLRFPFYPITMAVAIGIFILSLNILYAFWIEIKTSRAKD